VIKDLKHQQGDVLIYVAATIPAGAKLCHLTLAEGEVTGHSHRVVAHDPTNLESVNVHGAQLLQAEDGTLYLDVTATVDVVHEEHDIVTLNPGQYEIGIVREVDPFENEIRRVAD